MQPTEQREADPLCAGCSHPRSLHTIRMFDTWCNGKSAMNDETPVWVMSKPCKCHEYREEPK